MRDTLNMATPEPPGPAFLLPCLGPESPPSCSRGRLCSAGRGALAKESPIPFQLIVQESWLGLVEPWLA